MVIVSTHLVILLATRLLICLSLLLTVVPLITWVIIEPPRAMQIFDLLCTLQSLRNFLTWAANRMQNLIKLALPRVLGVITLDSRISMIRTVEIWSRRRVSTTLLVMLCLRQGPSHQTIMSTNLIRGSFVTP